MNNKKIADQPEGLKSKKSPLRTALLVIAGLIFAVVVAALISWWSFFNRFVVRSRNSAAQNLLHQLALAQVACSVETGRFFTDWSDSYKFGFRLDPNVRVKLVVFDLNIYGHKLNAFQATANHIANKEVFIYDNLNGTGVSEPPQAKPLGDEYTFHLDTTGKYDGHESVIPNGGPPITVVWVRLPPPGANVVPSSEVAGENDAAK